MAEQAQKEPTMEEILSSIRKIIAEDDSGLDSPAGDGLAGSAPEKDLALDVFLDSDEGLSDDDFEPDMPSVDNSHSLTPHTKADTGFGDDSDSFAIEDHEADDELADIMDFIDFKKDPTPETEPASPDAMLKADADIMHPLGNEDAFEADAPESELAIEAEYIPNTLAPDKDEIHDNTGPAEAAQDKQSETLMTPPLMDHMAASAAAGSLSKLMQTVEFGEEAGGNKTIDSVVKELLRPMLKAWLDENLQGLVESQVEAEIKRIGRRAG